MMRTSLAFLLFTLLLAMGAIAHLGIGARFIAPKTVVEAFFHFDPRNFDHNIIIKLRLLRLCGAMVTGAALGVAGVLLQSVIRNPLGEPHILGLNAGAALAVVLTSALGLTLPFGRPLIAAAGAAALFLLVLMFSSSGRAGLTPMKVTLCGVAMSAFAASITATVLILDEQTLLAMRTWLAGDLAGLSGETIAAALWVAAMGFVLALGLSPSLNMLAMGDRMAQGLGVSLLKTRLLALLSIALLCGAAVSLAGPIGFIGLVVPQLIRRVVSVDLRVMVPLSALCGALVLLLADIAARTLFTPWELATGIMTALVARPSLSSWLQGCSNEPGWIACVTRGGFLGAGSSKSAGVPGRPDAGGLLANRFWPDARLASRPRIRHWAGAVLSRKPDPRDALYRDGYPSAAPADGGTVRRDARHGWRGNAVHYPQWPGGPGAYRRERGL